MTTERSNIEGFWDEFCDWCDDSGVGDPRNGGEPDDWNAWWECWNAALDAKEDRETNIDQLRPLGE